MFVYFHKEYETEERAFLLDIAKLIGCEYTRRKMFRNISLDTREEYYESQLELLLVGQNDPCILSGEFARFVYEGLLETFNQQNNNEEEDSSE